MDDERNHWLIEYRLPILMYGGLCLGLGLLISQIITSLLSGQVSLGRYGELVVSLATSPVLFWIGICVYAGAGIGITAMIYVLAKKDIASR